MLTKNIPGNHRGVPKSWSDNSPTHDSMPGNYRVELIYLFSYNLYGC